MKRSDESSRPAQASPLEAAFEVFLIVVVFFLHAGWPVPDVNEAHYLTKAKNYWDATWGRGDFFLESADAHAVFYWTFGWLTRFFELPTVAWIGRVATWLLLAWSWRRLSVAIVPKPLASVLTAALLVTLIDWTHMAGEWLVGGVEAKGFAYAFVFLALEAACRDRWRWVWPWLGVASSFHPLVGGWSTIAAALAWWWSGPTRLPLRKMAPSLMLGLLLALPGLYFTLRLTVGIDADTVGEANALYVFRRLPHHVAIWKFNLGFRMRHLLAVVVFLMACLLWRRDQQSTLRLWVIGVLLISMTGALLSLITLFDEPMAAAVLRYYWYRVGDVAVPMALSIMAADAVALLKSKRPAASGILLVVLMVAAGWHLAQQNLEMWKESVPRADKKITRAASLDAKEKRYQDWLAACDWVKNNTQPDSRFLTPRLNQTFKWHTGRPEVVTQKDIPQDATSIVEWWRRIEDLYRFDEPDGDRKWRDTIADQGQAYLEALGWQYGAQYALVPGSSPITIRRIGMTREYVNSSFTIYKLPEKPQ